MLSKYFNLTRLDRPAGILLLLWPTLWGLWLANRGTPSISLILIFVTGSVLMRTAGCIINDLFDLPFDGYVKRTKRRALVRGIVSKKQGILVALALVLGAASLLVWLNELSYKIALSSMVFVVMYPLMNIISSLKTLLAQIYNG